MTTERIDRPASATSARAALMIDHVSKTYYPVRRSQPPVLALDDVSFSVEPGEFISLVGPSGCGKSTMLNILGGLLAASAGAASFQGVAITEPRPEIGMMFQSPVLFPWRTVLNNVLLPVDIRRQGRKTVERWLLCREVGKVSAPRLRPQARRTSPPSSNQCLPDNRRRLDLPSVWKVYRKYKQMALLRTCWPKESHATNSGSEGRHASGCDSSAGASPGSRLQRVDDLGRLQGVRAVRLAGGSPRQERARSLHALATGHGDRLR